jgi:hypothetical protein
MTRTTHVTRTTIGPDPVDGDPSHAAARSQRLGHSLAFWAEAERLIPGGSQTNSKRPVAFAFGRYPIYAARAEGCRIWDVDGHKYVDYVNGLGPITLGYRYRAVDEAIRAQLDKGILAGLLWPVEVEAARGLVDAVPCAEQVRFFKGGGEATAAAARIARAATGRHVILNAGYRGWPDTWAGGRDPAVPPEVGATSRRSGTATWRSSSSSWRRTAAKWRRSLPTCRTTAPSAATTCKRPGAWRTRTGRCSASTRSSPASGWRAAACRSTSASSPTWPASPRGWPTGCRSPPSSGAGR